VIVKNQTQVSYSFSPTPHTGLPAIIAVTPLHNADWAFVNRLFLQNHDIAVASSMLSTFAFDWRFDDVFRIWTRTLKPRTL